MANMVIRFQEWLVISFFDPHVKEYAMNNIPKRTAEVMGWFIDLIDPRSNGTYWIDAKKNWTIRISVFDWQPHKDLNQAMMVADFVLRKHGKDISICEGRGRSWGVKIGAYAENYHSYELSLEELPLAICEAILEAVE